MKAALRSLHLVFAVSLAACSAPAQPDASTDAAADAARDSATADASMMEVDVELDSAREDSPATDSGVLNDGSSIDATTGPDAADVATSDAARDGVDPPASCMYTNVDDVVVRCGTMFRFVSLFDVVPASSECPPYWKVGAAPPASTAAGAATNAGCDTNCVWNFSMSVTRLYCGVRSGYEVLDGAPSTCGRVYRFAEGYFNSVEEHDRMFPCPRR